MPGRVSHLDPKFDRALRDVMFDRALPCPHCRYDLRGLMGTRCPECGRNVEHHLRIADLSPGRIRAERLERRARAVVKALKMLVLLAPVVAAGLWLMLARS